MHAHATSILKCYIFDSVTSKKKLRKQKPQAKVKNTVMTQQIVRWHENNCFFNIHFVFYTKKPKEKLEMFENG